MSLVASEIWEPAFYGSGTCLVRRRDDYRAPYLYVCGPRNDDDDQWMRDRYAMCYQLTEYLNGGKRPLWLADMRRTKEDEATDLDGSSIRATGPMVDKDPPNLHWVEDDSYEAAIARARLMDMVFGIKGSDS